MTKPDTLIISPVPGFPRDFGKRNPLAYIRALDGSPTLLLRCAPAAWLKRALDAGHTNEVCTHVHNLTPGVSVATDGRRIHVAHDAEFGTSGCTSLICEDLDPMPLMRGLAQCNTDKWRAASIAIDDTFVRALYTARSWMPDRVIRIDVDDRSTRITHDVEAAQDCPIVECEITHSDAGYAQHAPIVFCVDINCLYDAVAGLLSPVLYYAAAATERLVHVRGSFARSDLIASAAISLIRA